jgi:hypothetical protein
MDLFFSHFPISSRLDPSRRRKSVLHVRVTGLPILLWSRSSKHFLPQSCSSLKLPLWDAPVPALDACSQRWLWQYHLLPHALRFLVHKCLPHRPLPHHFNLHTHHEVIQHHSSPVTTSPPDLSSPPSPQHPLTTSPRPHTNPGTPSRHTPGKRERPRKTHPHHQGPYCGRRCRSRSQHTGP